jgi:hypothetical protein
MEWGSSGELDADLWPVKNTRRAAGAGHTRPEIYKYIIETVPLIYPIPKQGV